MSVILCGNLRGEKCTCGAPADTPNGMHHSYCPVNPASRRCPACGMPIVVEARTMIPAHDFDGEPCSVSGMDHSDVTFNRHQGRPLSERPLRSGS